MPGTPHSRATVIGKAPPGYGDTGPILRIGSPRFQRSAKDWDTCEEELWVRDLDLAQLVDGYERTDDLMAAGYLTRSNTARLFVTGYSISGYKAGRPVIRLMSKGWLKTKSENWSGRRAISGDAETMNLGGFSYATRITFATTASLAITVLSAPSTNFGLTGTITPTYLPDWPYWLSGATAGWFYSGRDIDRLPGNIAICKITDTWSRLMNKDGTNT